MKMLLPILVGSLTLISVARAADPCDGFTWNVTVERALFAQEAQSMTAGTIETGAPMVKVAALYAISLAPQENVHFALTPTKKTLPDGAHAGLAKIHLAHAGRYRVSLDTAAWVDVIMAGQFVSSRAFTGQHDCRAPAKIVEYELPSGDALIQLSAASPDHIRLAMTESPPAAP